MRRRLRGWLKGFFWGAACGALMLGCQQKPPAETESAPAPAALPPAEEEEPAAEAPSLEEDQDDAEQDQAEKPPPSPAPIAPGQAAGDSAGRGAGGGIDSKGGAVRRRPSPKPKAAAPKKQRSVDSLEDAPHAGLTLEQAERELEATFARLGDELRLSAPDCPSARQFAGRVCELAEHICRIAEQGGAPQQLATCVDGRNRCAESKRRLEEKCGD